MVAVIATIIAPVLIIALIGFLWARSGAKFDTAMITSLVMTLGTPSLLLDTFTEVRPSAADFAATLAAGLCVFGGFALLGIALLKLRGWSYRDYLGSLMFPNMGNMGLPLSLFAFGQEGLALAIVLFAMSAIGNFTIGTAIAAGRMDWKALLRMPIIYAVIGAVVLMTTDLQPPEWFRNTVSMLAGITVPLMLVALGVSLSRLKPRSLPRASLLAVARIGGGFAVGVLVCWIFGLHGAPRGAIILQATMPTAVFNYLFAERYGRAASDVAGIVLVSTLLSFATLPLLLWYLL